MFKIPVFVDVTKVPLGCYANSSYELVLKNKKAFLKMGEQAFIDVQDFLVVMEENDER